VLTNLTVTSWYAAHSAGTPCPNAYSLRLPEHCRILEVLGQGEYDVFLLEASYEKLVEAQQ